MEEKDDRPKWLLELENRKRKPRLAHEAGAGSPCLICDTKCPGLDLHFWRKICKNCKCARDDHDVDSGEFPQFDLLFGASGKSKKCSVFLPVKKQNQEETPFEWVPPDTSKELAADYMKALPDEKLPIKGSAGAAFRRQQLQKQLPLHDIDHKACDQLSDQERKQFEEYLERLKNYVGQGKVVKCLGARPFSKVLMTPANATDVQKFSPQHKLGPSSGITGSNILRTPSSFLPRVSHSSASEHPPLFSLSRPLNSPSGAPLHANLEPLHTRSLESSSESLPQGRYHRVLDNVFQLSDLAASEPVDNSSIPQKDKQLRKPMRILNSCGSGEDILSVHDNVHYPEYSESQKRSKESIIETETRKDKIGRVNSQLENPRGHIADRSFEAVSSYGAQSSQYHSPENIVRSTLDGEGLTYIREKLSSRYGNKEDVFEPGGSQSETREPKDVQRFADKGNKKLEKVEQNRIIPCEEESVQIQKPKLAEILSSSKSAGHNMPLASSTPFTKDSQLLQTEFATFRPINSNLINSEQLNNPVFPEGVFHGNQPKNTSDVSQLAGDVEVLNLSQSKKNCNKCGEKISIGEVIVTAEKAKNEVWHPGCFVCSVCDEMLADLVYFYHKGKLYCARDLATHLNIQRCFACDELIFTSTYTVAESHSYHVKHFCCWDCDKPLAGQQYTSENDRPLCLPCYQRSYAKVCNACNQPIAANQKGVAMKDLDFHVDDKCFSCFTCRKSLLNGKVGIRERKIFCSKECITQFLDGKS